MRLTSLSCSLLVAAVAAMPVKAAVIIDNFSAFQSVSLNCANIGVPASTTVVGGGILGGERDVRLDMTFCPGVGDLAVLVTSYYHSADAGVRGTSLAVWDGMDGDGLVIDPTGLGGVDLTEGGTQDAFQILVQQADLNSIIVLEVYTDGSNSSTFTLNLPGGALSADYALPYAGFVPNLGAGADFTNVGAISMLIDGTLVSSLDVIIDFLGTTSLLTALKTGALFIDNDNDGLIEAGETIRYTITVSNPADDLGATVEDVIFSDSPDPNTNLVAGSVTTSQGTVTTGNGGGDTDITVEIGDIVDGGSVIITFDVVVKSGVNEPVCNQGFLTHALERPIGTNLNLPTDDPNTPEPNDPTCLPIAYCGDGIFDPTDEECDDGNLDDNDDCSNDCTMGCGNGIVNTGEQCDDGNLDDNDDCSNNCTMGCGNGIVNTGEQCDDGNLDDNDDCSNNCTMGCGNGIVNTGEQCDDGNLDDNDDCSNDCTMGCGNGIVNTGEQCDDGNLDDNDDCSNNCTMGCGNGIVNTGEQCDDGNDVNDDGCTNDCNHPRCGDGILQAGEQCDDGNNDGGDGCSPTCNIEICGNGILDANEVCDGAANAACNGGNCLPDCTCENVSGLCGNGILDDGEECDGAANEACGGSFCRADCTCGDGEIPTVSEWGMAILALLLLTAAKLRFTERRTA